MVTITPASCREMWGEAINAPQLELLGMSWPPEKGWKDELIGTRISERLFASICDLKGKGLASMSKGERKRGRKRLRKQKPAWKKPENRPYQQWDSPHGINARGGPDGCVERYLADLAEQQAMARDEMTAEHSPDKVRARGYRELAEFHRAEAIFHLREAESNRDLAELFEDE